MMLPTEIRQKASEIKNMALRQAFCEGALAYAEYIGKADASATQEQADVEVLPPQFDEFWNAYDKKVGKSKAMKLWAKLTNKEKAACLDYLPQYKVAQPDKQYRKNPETFLRNKCWNDELIYSSYGRNAFNGTANRIGDGRAASADEQERQYIEGSASNLFAGID